MKTKIFSFSFFLFFLSQSLSLQAGWLVPIDNFSTKQYEAGTQNWQLALQHNGWFYAANNYGLLEYDGARWRLYGMWNGSVVRSITTSPSGEIFAGGSGEFGYYQSNSLGEMYYHSLTNYVPEQYRNFGEVWNICCLGSTLYIQTRHSIIHAEVNFRDNETQPQLSNLVVIPIEQRVFAMSQIHGGIFVGTEDGVYLLAGNQLNRLQGSDLLRGAEVRKIDFLDGVGVLIATDLRGLFFYDGLSIRPFHTDADSYIRRNQLYTMAVRDNQLAIGTVRGGIVLTDMKGKNSQYIDTKNGLQNNTVLSLMFDRTGNLWAGLDKGIDYIRLQSPVRHIDYTQADAGAGYTSSFFRNKLYLGTNQGLYVTDAEAVAPLRLVSGSNGQVWSLDQLQGSLLCSHNRGLFEVTAAGIRTICSAEGFWSVRPLSDGQAVAGSYSGFYLLARKNNKWEIARKIGGFSETSLRYEIDKNGYIWVVASAGLMRLKMSEDKMTLTGELVHAYNEWHDWINLFWLNGDLLVSSKDYCAVVNDNGELQPAKNQFALLQGEEYYQLLRQAPNGDVWFIFDDMLKVRSRLNEGIYADDVRIAYNGKNHLIGGFQHLNFDAKGNLLLGTVNGYDLLVDSKPVLTTHEQAYVRRLIFNNGERQVQFGESFPAQKHTIQLPFGNYSLIAEYSGSDASQSGNLYKVRLLPKEKEFTNLSDKTQREYAALEEGEYTLEVVLCDANGVELGRTETGFAILPPWYKSWWALLIYILLGIGALLFVSYFIYLMSVRHRQQLERENERQMREQEKRFEEERHQQELKIVQLEKERAEYELKSKSQELGSLMLSEVNRNEWVALVQDDLRKVSLALHSKQYTAAKKEVTALQEKLGEAKNAEVDWSRYEENFDIVNDKFLRKLQQRFPWMNKNERKLCAYIHMGLLTKEIAPLLHMTTRGVEMMRYRMRKKMGLDEQANMKEYFAQLAAEE